MKAYPVVMASLLGSGTARRNVAQLLRLVGVLVALVIIYSVGFHYVMLYEGREGEYSWFTGFYWVLTVMSTLGFGDITFHSDLGRAFAIFVLMSGLVSLLIIFPFTFIQFFWAPWLEAQRNAQAPRELPPDTTGHVILTARDPVSDALVRTLEENEIPYALLVPTVDEALDLHDNGYDVMVGEPDMPEVYHRARVRKAALVAATGEDEANANVAFTVREISESVPIVTIASRPPSVDILELAGSNHVLLLGEMLGHALARRAAGSDRIVHTVGAFGQLCIAEAVLGHTGLARMQVRDTGLREQYGVTIAGLWERGRLQVPRADDTLAADSVAILVGAEERLEALNADLIREREEQPSGLVLVIGGGRVGRAAVEMLERRGASYRVLERDPRKCPSADACYVMGDASELEALQRAGLMEALTVIITTQEDDTNIYLTIYCRRLCPDLQIISRATLERNVDTLHRAGADFVMSYASLGARTITNLLSGSEVRMIAEGLILIRVPTPQALVGKSIAGAAIRSRTGCSVVALIRGDETTVAPPPGSVLTSDADLVMIGTVEAERRFASCFANNRSCKN